MSKKVSVFFGKFFKGALAGGLGSVMLVLQAGHQVASVADVLSLGKVVLAAFVSGAGLAIWKMITWKE